MMRRIRSLDVLRLLVEDKGGKTAALLEAADPIPEGTTFENDRIRVHRYRSAIRVWDLTNAGLRGKVVPIFVVHDLDFLPEDQKSLVDAFSAKLRKMDYAKAEPEAKKFLSLLGEKTNAKMHYTQEKGIRVDPPNQPSVEVNGSNIAVRIERQSFWVRDLTDPANEPTLIPRHRKAASTKRLYAWALQNKAKIKRMTFRQMKDLMSSLGVDYHHYLAVD